MSAVYNITPTIVPQFLSADECDRILKLFRSGKKLSGRLRPAVRQAKPDQAEREVRRSTICWLNETNRNRWIYEKVRELLIALNQEHYQFELNGLQPIQLARYKGDASSSGEFYGSHLDSSTVGHGTQRKLSLTVQLTPPGEYEGGDLILFGDHNDRILDPAGLQQKLFHRRQLGTAIIFPSFFAHEVLPVTNGTRHSLVAWMEGPNWK